MKQRTPADCLFFTLCVVLSACVSVGAITATVMVVHQAYLELVH